MVQINPLRHQDNNPSDKFGSGEYQSSLVEKGINSNGTWGHKFGSGEYPSSQDAIRAMHLVTLEEGEDGMIVAKCPDINIVTQGRTSDEAEKNAVEAVGLMREELGNDNEFSILIRRRP